MDDFNPDAYLASKANPAPAANTADSFNPDQYLLQKQYGGAGQQAMAGLEGIAQGVAGPLAPLAERAVGIPAEDIRSRAEANPITHGIGEGVGFTGSLFVPELKGAGLAAQVGNVGEKAAALLPEAASVIARTGIKASAEMAALQTSNELSKMVLNDPGQTLGSAAINIGLSGVIGGVGGAALGAVSPLWAKAKNVTGVDKLVSDYMAESQAIAQSKLVNPADALSSEFEAIPASKGNTSPGVKLARWVDENGASAISKSIGRSTASTVGAGIGALVGHPIAGAWMGDKVLGGVFSALAKPLAEGVLDSSAAKASVDYLGNVIKGQNLLDSTISKLFSSGSEILAKDLIPTQSSRNLLQKSLDFASVPDNAVQVGGKIGHYLPSHATAAAETTAAATNLFNSMKPTQPVMNPMDATPPIDKASESNYNRALDIAQQPLLALQHVKKGTLLPQDVQVLRTVFPNLHDAMIGKISTALIQNPDAKQNIPYAQRVSMNMFIGGNPLDGTMTPMAMQSIIHSASPQSQIQAAQTKSGGQRGHSSQSVLSQINKVNALTSTSTQASQINKRK